jgi:two-component system phosphate regulon sensor histidine kinase PhoR
MPSLDFLLGLALGITLCFCQRWWIQRQIHRLLELLLPEAMSIDLPMLSRLRRAISLTKQYQQHQTEQLNTWQAIMQVAPVGFLRVDAENQLLWCNQEAQKLLRIHPAWPQGNTHLLIALVRSYELDQLIEQTRTEQQPQMREWLFYPFSQDAEEIGDDRLGVTLRGSSCLLPDEQIAVFLENRQPLVNLAQSRNQWVSDLAHELRTPLTSIQLVVEMLQGRLDSSWNQRLERLLHEINRLIQLVKDWLELSQMEVTPSEHLSCKSFSLHHLIDSVWQTLEPLAQQKQLILNYSGPTNLCLEADEDRIYRVFLNIFDNSIRYSPPESNIQVIAVQLPDTQSHLSKTSQVASGIQIDIIDTGSGFCESDLASVFDRFYRADLARTKQSHLSNKAHGNGLLSPMSTGTGLGLAIVKQIIEAHCGWITAQNHPDTGGAWLRIWLPSSLELK